MTSLRDRCKKFYQQAQRDAIDDLLAFVQSELGRKAGDGKLDDTCSLVLYFGNEADRAEFKMLMAEVKPNWKAKELP